LLFKAAGVAFEDERVTQEQWQTRKPTTPFKHIPVLDFNGKVLSESHAIERFVANQLGLNGSNALEAAQVDIVVEWMEDVKTNFRKARTLPASEQPAFKKKFFDEDLPKSVQYLEEYLNTLGYAGPHAVGTKLSLADITLAYNFTFFWEDVEAIAKVLEGRTKINAAIQAANSNPGVAAWTNSRPNTPF